MSDRFQDPMVRLYALAAYDIHVVCPRCSARAVVAPRPVEGVAAAWWPRRLACASCGHGNSWEPRSSIWGNPVDPYFRLPLWLRADCRGHLLWAFNEQHLDLLEGYVAARLRERRAYPGSMSMLARLPRWLKSAKNRDEVLRTIRKLRATLPG